jgi:hypothetical protein
MLEIWYSSKQGTLILLKGNKKPRQKDEALLIHRRKLFLSSGINSTFE